MATRQMLRTITITLIQTIEDDEALTIAVNDGLSKFQEAVKDVAWCTKVEAVRLGNPQEVGSDLGVDPLSFKTTL